MYPIFLGVKLLVKKSTTGAATVKPLPRRRMYRDCYCGECDRLVKIRWNGHYCPDCGRRIVPDAPTAPGGEK